MAGRPLVLGGVTLPWDVGLEGHSDGDVVCHALSDALLGASGLGDMGRHFPSSDPKWKDAPSIQLLAEVAEMARRRGLGVWNADLTVILEVPRLEAYRAEISGNLAGALGVDPGLISLKAKTHDRLGPVGAGEAIAALAVVLVGADQ